MENAGGGVLRMETCRDGGGGVDVFSEAFKAEVLETAFRRLFSKKGLRSKRLMIKTEQGDRIINFQQ